LPHPAGNRPVPGDTRVTISAYLLASRARGRSDQRLILAVRRRL